MEDLSLEAKPRIMTEEGLISRIEALKEKLRIVEAEYGGKHFMFEELKRLHEQFINDLIYEKDQFKQIFKTELGSIYFVLHNGKSFRVKNKKYGYELQPIMDQIDFYNGDYLDGPEIGATPAEVTFYTDGKVAKHRGHEITEIIKS